MKNRNKTIYKIFLAVIFVMLVAYLVYLIFFSKEDIKSDIRRIIKTISLIVIYGAAVFGVRIKRRPSISTFKLYEDAYADIIRDAFNSDKSSRRKLLTAINCYNNNQNQKAIKILDNLKDKCETPDDISAVLTFKALCCSELCLLNTAVECYEELLKTDASNSKVWSNLGNLYLEQGKTKEAMEACSNAVRYDPENAFAYNNMAAACMNQGDMDGALKYAIRALELKDELFQAAGIAAIASANLGDREKAEQYYKIYSQKGGNKRAKAIRILIDNINSDTP